MKQASNGVSCTTRSSVTKSWQTTRIFLKGLNFPLYFTNYGFFKRKNKKKRRIAITSGHLIYLFSLYSLLVKFAREVQDLLVWVKTVSKILVFKLIQLLTGYGIKTSTESLKPMHEEICRMKC